jgi:hypothetical protein
MVKGSLRSSSSGAMSDFAAWPAALFGRVDHRDSCNDAAFSANKRHNDERARPGFHAEAGSCASLSCVNAGGSAP